MGFKIGDRVSFLNEKREGVVKGFGKHDMVIVEIEDGFEVPVPAAELINLEEEREEPIAVSGNTMNIDIVKRLSVDWAEDETEFLQREDRKSDRRRRGKSDEIEVDLHIHELTDRFAHLSNSEILAIQLSKFRRSIENAISNRQSRLIIIHGVGNGVLKSAVRKVLDEEYPELNYQDASYRRYGFGATLVEF